jgi:hypothetical protein
MNAEWGVMLVHPSTPISSPKQLNRQILVQNCQVNFIVILTGKWIHCFTQKLTFFRVVHIKKYIIEKTVFGKVCE